MNLHISNLSEEVTEADLGRAFSRFGHVASVTILREKSKGKPKVSGDVVMPDDAEAESAIHALDGKNLKKRPMKIAPPKGRGSGRQPVGARRNPGDKRGGTQKGGRRF